MIRRGRIQLGVVLALVGLVVVFAEPVQAQGLFQPDLGDLIPEQFRNLNTAFAAIWNVVVGVSGVAFLGLLLYGGFLYLTSAGHEPQVERAKHTLRDALIGLVLVILAWPIGVVVLSLFGQQRVLRNGAPSGLSAPTATSGTPLNPIGSTGTTTTPTTTIPGSTTSTTPTTTIPGGATAIQTTVTTTNAKPNSTFSVHQPGHQTQTVTVGSTGQASYTLDPSQTYTQTTLVFVSSQNTSNTVSSVVVNIIRQLTNGDQLMYANVQPNANGQITLNVPVGEKLKITKADSGIELARDQEIKAGTTELRVVVP